MPISFSSPPRNLFLLGSSGADVVTNFFKTIDRSAGTDDVYIPDEIKFNYSDETFLLAGSAEDSNNKGIGWFEKRTQGGSSDWDVRVEATTSANTTLRAMELDSNDNLIVVGRTGSIPWIAKYSNGGVIDWQSTTNSAGVEYTGITSDSSGNYYACGNTPEQLILEFPVSGDAQAFVEKFDSSGNPGWGKSAFMVGRDVVLNKVAANARGEVVAVGYLEDDSRNKGYIVKIDTNTGEVLWDRTIADLADYGLFIPNTELTDVYIDSIDQIYVVGSTQVNSTRQFVIKYTAEGNIVWQKQSSNDVEGSGADIVPVAVKSDGETQQTIVASSYTSFGFAGILLSKYGKSGNLVWRRMLSTDFEPSQLHSISLDADPSFYYLLYSDETINFSNGTPDQYTFGKVSSSGNGLGDFQYQDGTGTTIDYETSAIQDELGRLTDGSVRNDSSDLITYPFSPNKILFDDLATQVSNKKRQMDSADSFEYSGSPAIRPADFQELNLLGDVYSGSGNWLDQSGKGNDGVINGATYNAAGYWEFVSPDPYVSGVNVEIPNPIPANPQSPFTFEAWVWRDTSDKWQTIMSMTGSYTQLAFGSTNTIRFGRNGGLGGSNADSNFSTSAGTWYHVVGTYDGNQSGSNAYVDIYVNGEIQVSGTTMGVNGLDNGSTIRLGMYGIGSGGEWLNGRIGEVRIYPRALTPAQVFQNYNATKSKYLNEAPDTTPKISNSPIVYDSSLILNYDFGNKATYETRPYLLPSNQISSTEQKITASDAVAGDQFGRSVAVGYNKIVVGRQQSSTLQGAVYIYDLDGTNEVKITASDGAVGDQFGYSVAIGYNKIVVGAFGSEAIYIYDLDGTNEVKVTTSDSGATAYTGYGYSVAVGSNKIVVGAMNYSPTIGDPVGAAYVYDLDGTNEIKITASDGERNDRFGQAVAVGDNKIVVGANQDDDKSGSAYIYDLDGTNEIKITASDVVSDNYFGRAVAVGSNRIVVGAYNGDIDNVYDNFGAIYIFDLDGNQLAKITASDAAYFDQFGWVVAIASNRIVVGAPYKEALGGSRPGAVYILDLNGNELAKITASDGANDDRFALGIAAGDNKILVGAYFDDDDGNNSGSVYIYNLSYSLPTTVKNLSSSSYTGTINGATFNSAGYFDFPGYGDAPDNQTVNERFIDVGPVGAANDFSGGMTVSVWFNFDAFENYENVLDLNYFTGFANRNIGPRLEADNAGNFRWYYSSSITSGNYYGQDALDSALANNTWYNCAWTFDGASTIKTYENGVDTLSTPITTGTPGTGWYGTINHMVIGGGFNSGSNGARMMNGKIGEVMVYNRALSAAELLRNFNATRAKYGV